MRAVLDTNVLVSALLTPGGLCRKITDHVFAGRVQAFVDERMLREYEAVARRPELPINPAQAETLLTVMSSAAAFVVATPLAVALPHPHDLPFLEVAHEMDATLVTGNLRHFPRKARRGVIVLSPREFLELLEDSSH